MKKKHHEYILKAFLETKIPKSVKMHLPDLVLIDSVVGGYCSQVLKSSKFKLIKSEKIISKDEKNRFSEIINYCEVEEKDELIIYYRLLILVESVLLHYCETGDGLREP